MPQGVPCAWNTRNSCREGDFARRFVPAFADFPLTTAETRWYGVGQSETFSRLSDLGPASNQRRQNRRSRKCHFKGMLMHEACSLCGRATDRGSSAAFRICDDCLRALPALCAHLESLDYAAALISRNLTIIYSNSRFCEIAGTSGNDSVGRSIGETLGCAHARSDGSHGEKDACPQCWFRRATELAVISGERLPDLEVDLALKTGTRASYKVSAERAGEAVILTIRRSG